MHCFKRNGKPQLDASGNLILSKNARLFTTTGHTAGPRSIDNANYIMLRPLSTWGRFRASLAALNWIWSN